MSSRLDRIERSEEVLVDVIDCVDQPDLISTSLACRTIDISETGMKLDAGMPIPVNTTLSLRLDFAAQLFRLEGKVRWATDDGGHFIGLVLNEDSPDLSNWSQMFDMKIDS
jgi:hypothetical protein